MSKQQQPAVALEPGSKVIAFPGNKIQIVLTPRVLGKGQYGTVHYGYLKDNPNKIYAVKVIDKKRIRGKVHDLLTNEVEIMTEIQHKNVVGLICGTKTVSNYYLVLEHCNGGDVDGLLKARRGYLSESEARTILKQLVQGLLAIKAQNVIHRDLKLSNILINFPSLTKDMVLSPDFNLKAFLSEATLAPSQGRQAIPFDVKIADLGFSRKLEEGQLAETRLGTPLVMAPEVLDGNRYDHTADVWSLGCIFYEMLTGFAPFTGTSQGNLAENIARGNYFFPKTLKFSIQGLSFLNSCLQYDHALRPSLAELMNHPYIAMDDSLEQSTQQDLFLSYHPETKKFMAEVENPLRSNVCDGTNAGNISHAEILKKPNVHHWLKTNPESVIPLCVHGNQQYEHVVEDRLMKLEAKRQREEEEAKAKQAAAQDDDPFADISDEELKEEIRQQRAQAEKDRESNNSAAAAQDHQQEAEFGSEEVAGDKMVETEFMVPDKADVTMSRFSMVHERLLDTDGDAFRSAFDSQQRIIDHQQQTLLDTPPATSDTPKKDTVSSSGTFNTHAIDSCPTDTDLIEQAKLLAHQKSKTSAQAGSSTRLQQEEAKKIRSQDNMLFGSSNSAEQKEDRAAQHKQAIQNEFQQSAMMASTVDMLRDSSYLLATNSGQILVENKMTGTSDLSRASLDVQLNYF